MPPSLGQPLPYHPDVERREPAEAASVASLQRSVRSILGKTWRNYGHAVRGVHAKSHGLLEGELHVRGGLPPALAQGLFARPGAYPAVVRVSINPSDVMDDSISAPRGIAVKVIGVTGERLPGSEGDVTQDFTFVNGPYFVVPSVRIFTRTFKMLAISAETGQAWKKVVSAVLRGVAAVLNAAGTDSGLVKGVGGQVLTHPLGGDLLHPDGVPARRLRRQAVPAAGLAGAGGDEGQAGGHRRPAERAACGGDRLLQGPRCHLGAARAASHQSRDHAGRGFVGALAGGGKPLPPGCPPGRATAAGVE